MAIQKTRNNIITQALEKIGVVAPGENPKAEDITSGSIQLDYMVKTWQSTGAHLWSQEEGILFLQPNQQQYILGGSTTTDQAAASELDVIRTLLADDAVATDTVLTVDSETGIVIADRIGVLLNTGSLFWSTVASLSPLTINDSLPSDAASGRVVWTYTTVIPKPLKIPASRRNNGGITGITGQDVQMSSIGREDYYNLPQKNTPGITTQYYYQPQIDSGNIRLWPVAQDSTLFLKFTYLRPIDIFDNSSSAPDFPNEWLFALVYNLALNLIPNYGINANAYPLIPALAAEYLNKALDWDTGDAPIFFQYGFGQGQ